MVQKSGKNWFALKTCSTLVVSTFSYSEFMLLQICPIKIRNIYEITYIKMFDTKMGKTRALSYCVDKNWTEAALKPKPETNPTKFGINSVKKNFLSKLIFPPWDETDIF